VLHHSPSSQAVTLSESTGGSTIVKATASI
jgi:hypothetical protein